MGLITIDLLSDLEQGSISSSANSSSTKCLRTASRFMAIYPSKVKITVTTFSGKSVQYNFVGYANNTTNSWVCSLYWYDSGFETDTSSYDTVLFFRLRLQYSDASNITADDIASCSIEFDEKPIWHIGSDGFPTNGTPAAPDNFVKPYPKSYWRITPGYNNGFPYHELMPDVPHTSGAFNVAKNLRRAYIPESVKVIGDAAFKDTALRRVTIAADCEYNAGTSFPPDCVVRRYPDQSYAQLYDCDGKAVLDSRGARIYVKKE